MAESEALFSGLQLDITYNLKPLEVEFDSTDLLLYLEEPISLYSPLISSCISMLRKLGNQVVRHNFWQGNKVADFLCKIACQLTTTPQSCVLLSPVAAAEDLLKTDKEGVLSSKLILRSTCNKLARFGNLFVITSTNSDHVRFIV
ncbi:hypothetical protein RDI58_019682 [Solanum bulbocastanum]|uniref:RNase H type-1 domain-containing protein n=1 Tax=Solanum bulbocastanum TaxID=147425 RepID=A0AAN8Y7T7_SOLBU